MVFKSYRQRFLAAAVSALFMTLSILFLEGCGQHQDTGTVTPSDGSPGCSGILRTVTDYEGKPETGDYSYMWYPDGYTHYREAVYIQTGHYAMKFRLGLDGSGIRSLGVISDPKDIRSAGRFDNAAVESMPSARDAWSVSVSGDIFRASRFTSLILEGDESAEAGQDTDYQLRLITSGNYLQQAEIPYVEFSGSSVRGWMRFCAAPEMFALNLRFTDENGNISGLSSEYRLQLDSIYDLSAISEKRVTATAPDGSGFIFTILSEDSDAELQVTADDGGAVHFSAGGLSAVKGEYTGFTVILLPFSGGSRNDFFTVAEKISVDAATILPNGSCGEKAGVRFDSARGLYSVELPGITMDVTDEVERHKLNRVLLSISNPSDESVSVPLVFDGTGNASRYIVGGCAMLLDAETGEPVGTNVQISKNWHDGSVGWWYQFATVLHIPANTEQKIEFAITSENWGEATGVHHSQLCLVGYYNGNWLWDESGIGASGESITYDMDKCLGRSRIDDVRGWMVRNAETGGEWGWSGNVGGADFLVYKPKGSVSPYFIGMKNDYVFYGPNLTNVVYSGRTADNRVEMNFTMQLGRTDDVVRAYYTVEATFLKDVEYERLALFQTAADGYSDNSFRRFAYSTDGTEISFDGETGGWKTGYRSEEDRFIPAETGCWFFLYGSSNRPEESANTLAVVREYSAVINGTEYDEPYFSIYHNGQGEGVQPSFEISLPPTEDNLVRAGSTVRVVIEYTVVPADAKYYYGTCGYITGKTTEQLDSPEMALFMAESNIQELDVSVGRAVRMYPNVIETVSGHEAARFSFKGGLGYSAFTFTGLDSYSGWELQTMTDSGWARVDQSSAAVFPGDPAVADLTANYTQCNYDAATDSYSVTYNLPASEIAKEYRLVGQKTY